MLQGACLGVDDTRRVAERPGGVAHGRARPVGDDVGDLGGVVASVAGVDVLDDLLAAAGLDVEVDVRVAGSPLKTAF